MSKKIAMDDKFDIAENVCYDVSKEKRSASNKNVSFKKKYFILATCIVILLLASVAALSVIALVQAVKIRSELNELQENSSVYSTLVGNQIDQRMISNIEMKLEDYFLNNISRISEMLNNLPIFSSWADDISINVSLKLEDFILNNISRVLNNLPIFSSCADALQKLPFSTSGYQLIWHNAGSLALVYCDMTLSCGGVTGGWRRTVYINTAISGTHCPSELTNRNDPSSCIKIGSAPGCSSVKYPSSGISYSRICGGINGRQAGIPDAFRRDDGTSNQTLEQNYVDGVSLTYGSSPRTHIWTFATGTGNVGDYCPYCDIERPGYIDNDYSCDMNDRCTNGEVCSSEVLWNGSQCVGGKMFYKELQQRTTEDIEMRVCRDQPDSDEDILITFVELYVQ